MKERASALERLLADPEPETRRQAALRIPDVDAPDAAELVITALRDDDWRVRKEAARVAARVEPRDTIVARVANALGDRDDIALRNAAVEALIAIGAESIPHAISALSVLDADGRKLAVEVLVGAPDAAGMAALVRTLTDEDPNVRAAAAEGLGNAMIAGDAARELAIAGLVGVLSHEDFALRSAALVALGKLEADVPIDALESLAGDALLRRPIVALASFASAPRAMLLLSSAAADPSNTVGREAILALGHAIESRATDGARLEIAARTLRASPIAHARLRAFARDEEPDVRGASLLGLSLVRDPEDVAILVDALTEDDLAERAELALSLFGEDAVQPMLDAGKSAAPSKRGASISMVPMLDPEGASDALPALREALSDTSSDVLVGALRSFAMIGTEEDVPEVAHLTASAEARVAQSAQAALRALTSRHPLAARALLESIEPRGERALEGCIVLDALARDGRARAEDAGFLERSCTHGNARVRRVAVEALAHLGAPTAREAASFALADEDAGVVQAAIRALGKLAHTDALLDLVLRSRDASIVASALRALGEAAPEHAMEAARPLVRSSDPALACAAVDALARTDDDSATEALAAALDHPEREVVKVALFAIAGSSHPRRASMIANRLEHAAPEVRKLICDLLVKQPPARSEVAQVRASLLARLERERDQEIRAAITRALRSEG